MVGESGDVGDVDLEIVDSSFDPHPRSSSPHSLAGLAPPLLTGAEVESGLSSGVGPNLFRSKWIRCGCEVAIIVVAIIIAFVVGRASNSPGDTSAASDSAPVILVSFDGMRADYIDLAGSDRTPNFQSMKSRRDAVWAKGMRPSFPSLTFPNHYTLVTGMHPESHGIVGNYIYDPTTQKYFIYKDPATHSSEWWQAIPLWVTSQLYSIASGTIFWAGSEAEIDGRRPSVWLPYDGTLSNDARIDQLFEWIDSGKCTLCLIYFSDVDSAGHSFGAASPEALSATAAMDVLVGRIRSELRSRDLDTSASLVLVSDHGMATVTDSIYLDDYIDINSYGLTHQDLGAITNIWLPEPINATLTQQILANLSGIPHITCWAKESTPPKYHFGTSPVRNNARHT